MTETANVSKDWPDIEDRRAIGRGWVRPTLVAGGTSEQLARWLPGIDDGNELWCQLFSEPEAGSDLASLRTRARLDEDGATYVIDGQKIWTTWAESARWGILLARTGGEGHRGISYFVLDMRAPGIEIRGITEMTGGRHFNEVFLTGVRVPADHRIGEEGDGWRLATTTLSSERDALSDGGVIWGMGPTSREAFAHLGTVADPLRRQDAARVWTEMRTLEWTLDAPPSVRKCLADEHGQHVMAANLAARGAEALIAEHGAHVKDDDVWYWGWLFSRALTIGGGTSEIQRNVIGERILGLPR